MLDDDMRDIINQAKLAFGATTCADESPTLSPTSSLRVYDGTQLVFKDNASPKTIEDVCRDSRLEDCVIDLFRRRTHRNNGAAERQTPVLSPSTWGGADQDHLDMIWRDRYAQAQPNFSAVG